MNRLRVEDGVRGLLIPTPIRVGSSRNMCGAICLTDLCMLKMMFVEKLMTWHVMVLEILARPSMMGMLLWTVCFISRVLLQDPGRTAATWSM